MKMFAVEFPEFSLRHFHVDDTVGIPTGLALNPTLCSPFKNSPYLMGVSFVKHVMGVTKEKQFEDRYKPFFGAVKRMKMNGKHSEFFEKFLVN